MQRVNTIPRLVLRAQRAMRRAPDTRAIKRELQQGNPYVVALLYARGLVYLRGSGIVRIRDVEQPLNPKTQGEIYAPNQSQPRRVHP
jgi:hypothetical protein